MNISIILAAGQGTRMKSNLPKVLHKVCGKPILQYVINASNGANVRKSIVIVGHQGEMVRDYFENEEIIFKTQPMGDEYPYGTGFAVMQAVDQIEDEDTVIILSGDTPLITSETVNDLLKYHNENQYDGTVLSAIVENPFGYGRIKRDESNDLLRIIEQKDANENERKINEINSGVYCFNGRLLKHALGKLDNNNSQGEYYVTDVVGILNNEGYKIGAYVIDNVEEIHGVNSRYQLSLSEKIMRNRINEKFMANGVTFIDSQGTYIEESVKIDIDTIIYPGVTIEGDTVIGENCIIRSGSRIVNSRIDSNVQIDSSLIEDSIVEEGTCIGPNAHLRPETHLGKNVKIGNFVEVKNSYIGNNSKAGHLAYVGDANVGDNVNIGCGVVFANYNGRTKERIQIGDEAFIGSNSTLVAPITIEDKVYIAAGSTITKNVESYALSIGRAPQVNKKDWVNKKELK